MTNYLSSDLQKLVTLVTFLHKNYKGEVKIVEHDEFKRLVEDRNKDYIAMISARVSLKIFFMFDLESSKTLYIGGKLKITSLHEHHPEQFEDLYWYIRKRDR
ncbi:MAG: hypothetical protein HRT71_18265 [Flavobacteriales bacterium]|nr:hypothetical protein [Flavobacteriales bacterium]